MLPWDTSFHESGNDLTKYTHRSRVEPKSVYCYANVMDSKKVNVNGKCRLQGALYVDVLEGRMLPLEGMKRNNLTGDLHNL